MVADANGNLFGTTELGGANGLGTVFEIAKTATGYASSPITLLNFDGTSGAYPLGSLIADANGNLFGTAVLGGLNGYGTVFEIAKTATGYAGSAITLVDLNNASGGYPVAGLIADAHGNLFGTASGNPLNNIVASSISPTAGTVFEITGSGFIVPALPPTAISGGAILNDAISHLGETWGNFNCTGFVYSVSYETYPDDGFFDPLKSQVAFVGPRGTDGVGPLLNTKFTGHGRDNPDFLVPIGARSGTGSVKLTLPDGSTVYANPDPGDGWHLIGDSTGNNTTTVSKQDPASIPQPGDLFRGIVDEKNGHTLIAHSGVVSAYDPLSNSIWLVSNWETNSAPGGGGALITYDQFYLGQSGSSRDIAGPYAIYRLDGASQNNNIIGSGGIDHLGGGAGDDTIFGGLGGDTLWGGGGSNVFIYHSAAESTGGVTNNQPAFDTIADFNVQLDKLDFWFPIASIDNPIIGGRLRPGTFDSDLAVAVGPTKLGNHDAVLFTPSKGSYSGQTFLVVDANNKPGYQSGEDLVIRLQGSSSMAGLSTSNFVT